MLALLEPWRIYPLILQSPLETRRLVLGSLTEECAGGSYLVWMNDPEVTEFLESRGRKFVADDLKEFIHQCNANPSVVLLGIFAKSGGAHIGNIKLGPIEPRHKRGELGLVIGDKTRWGQGVAREAIAALSTYAFEVMDLHKVTAGCYAANEGSRQAFLGAGWHEEARRSRHCRYQGGWDDIVLLACFADSVKVRGDGAASQRP